MKQQITYIPIEKLIPHPDNPRKNLGDLTELVKSIRESGVYQNLTVVPDGENYKIIIGHRRRAAAELAGLTELPCIITEMTADEQLATMAVENMQRSDLTIVEQAQAMQMMLDIGFTADEISKKTGFSRSTVDKRLKVAALPKEEAKEAEARGGRLEDFVKLSRIESEEERGRLLQKVGTSDFEWQYAKSLREQLADKNRPSVKKWCAEHNLKKLKPSERWSMKYSTLLNVYFNTEDFDLEKEMSKFKFEDGIQYFVFIDDSNFVIEKLTPKAKPVKKSKREKEADAVRKELSEKFEQMYKLRCDFLENFTAHQKYKDVLQEHLLFLTLTRSIRYQTYNDKFTFKRAGVTVGQNYEDREKAVIEYTKKPEALFTAVASCLDDSSGQNCFAHSYGKEMPKYRNNDRLLGIYDFLKRIGYQLSTEEQQLLDGTHELYGG